MRRNIHASRTAVAHRFDRPKLWNDSRPECFDAAEPAVEEHGFSRALRSIAVDKVMLRSTSVRRSIYELRRVLRPADPFDAAKCAVEEHGFSRALQS